MPVPLTPLALELLQAPNIVFLATLMPDGSPQVSPLWVDTDGVNILVNSVRGRVKTNNVERDPRVAVSLVDANDVERSLAIRGRVTGVTSEGGGEHINKLSLKYRGTPFQGPDWDRVIITIAPEHIGT